MNRFKFRSWGILGGKGSFIYFDLDDRREFDWEIFDREPIILQFTGLQDKDGTDIYEGDIIKYPLEEIGGVQYHHFQVIWDNFYKCWALGDKEGSSLAHTGWKFYNCDMGEVVGNIFENVHLLNTEVY